MRAIGIAFIVSAFLAGLSILAIVLGAQISGAWHAWRWRRRVAYRAKLADRVFKRSKARGQ